MIARENPFTATRMHSVRYKFSDGDSLRRLRLRLEASGGRGMIVGPEGSGKSTLLDELCRNFAASGKTVFSLRAQRLNSIGSLRHLLSQLRQASSVECVFIDSSERLNRIIWSYVRWRLRKCKIIAGAAHSPGRLPTLYFTTTSSSLLSSIVKELLPRGAEAPKEISALFEEHGGNVRTALRELYDYYFSADASLELPQTVR